jgi:hypothetical protein
MLYAIHNVSREKKNRFERRALPTKVNKKQHIAGARILPARARIVDESVVIANLDALRAKVAAHALEVRTTDGQVVDLRTLVAAPKMPAPLRPHPLPDSAARDKPWGVPMEPDMGEDQSTLPAAILPDGQTPTLLTIRAQEEAADIAAELAVVAKQAPPAPPVVEEKAATPVSVDLLDAPGEDLEPVEDNDSDLEAALAQAEAESSDAPVEDNAETAEEEVINAMPAPQTKAVQHQPARQESRHSKRRR